MKDCRLTTVKVLTSQYRRFKILSIDTGMNLQKIVNRAIFNYINSEDFRELIDQTSVVSGSTAF